MNGWCEELLAECAQGAICNSSWLTFITATTQHTAAITATQAAAARAAQSMHQIGTDALLYRTSPSTTTTTRYARCLRPLPLFYLSSPLLLLRLTSIVTPSTSYCRLPACTVDQRATQCVLSPRITGLSTSGISRLPHQLPSSKRGPLSWLRRLTESIAIMSLTSSTPTTRL